MIQNEMQLLDHETRKKLIESFDSGKNACRKSAAYKAYECLNDKTNKYVMEQLLCQFEDETVLEMQYSLSNISILRKVISKLAKVYSNGVKRTMPTDDETQMIEDMAKELNFNRAMKKANKYLRAMKNALVYVRPIKRGENEFDLTVDVKAPFSYDVVEDPNDPTRALAIVLSDYCPEPTRVPRVQLRRSVDDEGAIMPVKVQSFSPSKGLGYAREDKREFIWWSKNFYFTTNAKGEILDTTTIDNPILELPFVALAEERDGQFFAEGGEDLVDAGVSINVMLTNTKNVGISQGYGQLYMTGKNLPKSVKVGPQHCVQMEHDKDDPTPAIGYLNSNPPLADLKALIEMETALMLTTNNLSTSGFSTSLGEGKDFASGIALLIDKSESIEDVGEQSEIFSDEEPNMWGLVSKWHEVLSSAGALSETFAALPMPADAYQVAIAFPAVKIPTSEKEELEVIEKRRDLGLNTEAELLMRDDPSLTTEEAEAKLEKIKEEKAAKMQNAATAAGDMNGDQSQKGSRDPGADDDNALNNRGAPNPGQGKDEAQA